MRRDRKLDFKAEHLRWLQERGGVPREDHYVAWEDVIHFVLLPNYKVRANAAVATAAPTGLALARERRGWERRG